MKYPQIEDQNKPLQFCASTSNLFMSRSTLFGCLKLPKANSD